MTPDQRKQFEEMASKACNGFVSFDPMCHGCMSAFRAVKTAWDMATSQRVLSDDAHWSAGYRAGYRAGKEEATKAERALWNEQFRKEVNERDKAPVCPGCNGTKKITVNCSSSWAGEDYYVTDCPTCEPKNPAPASKENE